MRDQLLSLFSTNTHSLILVSDPDGLLTDESILSALIERGFTIIQETDSILLRYRVEQAHPFHSSRPVLIITDGVLEDLPYDIWQQGQQVTLALHTFYPNLFYPVLRALTPFQLAGLSQVKQPNERLGERRTIEFLLEHVFGLHPNLLQQPAYFILWLDEFHSRLAPFPPSIEQSLLTQLQSIPEYKDWPLQQILRDHQAFQDFIQDQWQEFLHRQTGLSIGERAVEYLLHFETDQGLQDSLPRLLRNGALVPVQVTAKVPLPVWVVPGILTVDEDPRWRRMAELKNLLQESPAELTPESRWEDWQLIAQQWAEFSVLQNEVGISNYEESNPSHEIAKKLDSTFIEWLKLRYSALATQKLPMPHHLYHIPHYLSYLREQGTHQKVALLIMDGMSLSDWLLVKRAWQARQTNWRFNESLVLAQIPTITAISRHALISGLRPADFYIPNATKQTETKAWSAFWMRAGLPENAISLIAMNLERNDPTPEITNPRLQVLCLIERQLDEIMHGSMLGAVGHHANVSLWASQTNTGINSSKLEAIITMLLDQGFTVFISSDHGHCEADGIGKPAEGLMVQSRGRRARLYTDRRTAEHIQSTYSGTLLWEEDGLLPNNLFAVLPSGRKAFAEHGEINITHGGITMDEIVVPLIEISKK